MSHERILRPGYDRTMITPGIAHMGVGSFHRSHQAMYLDRLISLGDHNDWGIIGIGVMPGDIHMRDALTGQDFLYTLVEKYGDGNLEARVISSILGFLYAPENPKIVLETLIDPAIRIVSLTITEGGYVVDPRNPHSVFGYITEALRIRRARDIPPFTVMSCDNLPGNGDVTKQAILTYSASVDPGLSGWIDTEVDFPNSMVDRITPVTTDADRGMVKERFGIDDAWPVMTEPFTQWVMEDRFRQGRPAFEQVGVQMVDDVAPYELMKLRLLNASHQAMAYIGQLLGHRYVHEAVADADIERFLRLYLAEAVPTLAPVPGIDVHSYIEELFVRFWNPYIADTLARLAVDASDRIPKFVLPAVEDNLGEGREVLMGAAVVASWSRWLEVAEPGQVVDPLRDQLMPLAHDRRSFLGFEPVLGNLGTDDRFAHAVMNQLDSLRSRSPRQWLQQIGT